MIRVLLLAVMVGMICLTGCGDNGTKQTAPPNKTDTTGTEPGTTPGTEPGEIETVTVGGKTWMVSNLNVEVGNSWYYNDDDYNAKKYGRLYDWNTAVTKACTDGWRLPTDRDWNDMIASPGGVEKVGLAAAYAGVRFSDGTFGRRNFDGYWWSATESSVDETFAHYYGLSNKEGSAVRQEEERKVSGRSVRCVKN